ncbi:spermidine/putrescine transport system permease protein [Mycoplasma testudineum]|uniref:Spermidine/putrescine transport system permease protein n=1 Tax=Mycoplasma testudineum TaxID=244584 RepID=A0A4R6ICY5_9MOLU|nr:ABC transporter permease [Mycoplasma testudineum]TDO19447.1 spermidine/putrescine transport system permease protein [Mycoplasma testudineum]
MFNLKSFAKMSFISIIVLLTYIPIIFMVIFSFNKPSDKGELSFITWNGTTNGAYVELFSHNVVNAIANSTLIAFFTVLIVVPLATLIVYGLWRQKQKAHRVVVEGLANVALINPDIITALGLGVVFTSLFGAFSENDEGLFRAVISHVVVILPFVTLLLFPRSEKFNSSQFKASQDLGYGKIRTWFKTYLRYMLMPLIFATIVTVVLSFDDFILTRIVSNVDTVGVQLYSANFRPWALALGSLLFIVTIFGNLVYIAFKWRQNKNMIAAKNSLLSINRKFLNERKISVKNFFKRNQKEIQNV